MSTAEVLARKKRIRAGHKASASQMIRQVEETLGKEIIDSSKLSLPKCSLQEKLEMIRTLDGEIVDLIEDDKLTEEIEHAVSTATATQPNRRDRAQVLAGRVRNCPNWPCTRSTET
jgi:hypothetical protein